MDYLADLASVQIGNPAAAYGSVETRKANYHYTKPPLPQGMYGASQPQYNPQGLMSPLQQQQQNLYGSNSEASLPFNVKFPNGPDQQMQPPPFQAESVQINPNNNKIVY